MVAMPPYVFVLLATLAHAAAQVPTTDIHVGVVYAAPARVSDTAVDEELRALRRAGFNLVVPADEQTRKRVLRTADAGLHVLVVGDRNASRMAVGRGPAAVRDARLAFWTALAGGARTLAFAAAGNRPGAELRALGETAGVVTRNQALFAPLRPRSSGVRSISSGPMGPVKVRLLESEGTLVMIAVNDARQRRHVTISFARDIPEAIWQNLESGTTINFVMAKDGPFLEHTFAPRDALVLMMRKRLR